MAYKQAWMMPIKFAHAESVATRAHGRGPTCDEKSTIVMPITLRHGTPFASNGLKGCEAKGMTSAIPR
eukprot:scaffold68563_cov31-Tisochrysis_lutea.AAC.4